jgi:ABC-2 type transport system ATP-binding protein
LNLRAAFVTLNLVDASKLAISVRGLRKSYGDFDAVRGIDLEVSTGEVFALLGPNGAGKTTTVEILEGYRERSGGEVSVLGHDPWLNERDLKQRIGIVLQETGVEPYLTVEESIELYRGYYPSPRRVDEVIDIVGLGEQRQTRVRRLSGGQKRRLDVAIGLAGNPDLLFLDEPTTGFDPAARRQAWEMIRNLRSLGKTVLLTTHYLDEAEQLADRVAIIAHGEIVAEGSPGELIASDPASTIRFRLAAGETLPPGLGEIATAEDGVITIRTTAPTKTLYEVLRWANEAGVELEELSLTRASLEDVYLQLVAASEGATAEAKP